MSKLNEADFLFKRLDVELLENIDSQYFSEPREFRSLIEVLGVLGEKVDQINNRGEDLLAVLKDRNLAYSRLLNQRKMVEEVIEEVVKFQHGGLNNSVDTMSEVVKEYSRGRDDIRGLRKSLNETQSVLTSKKSGQIPLKELWLKKAEVEQSLRIVKELESVKNAPHRVQRFMLQKRYLTAVVNLNKAISNMFSEDLVQVTGLVVVREQLMDLKETLLETCVSELKDIIIIGSFAELELVSKECGSDSDEGGNSDSRSERSLFFDDNRSVRSRSIANSQMLSETDGNTSSNGMLSSVPGELAEQWPLDFKDLDEALETSLVDPSTSGSVFIRLLVKTVSVLHCEEDVERLLLENMSKRFRTISINRLKDFALARLHVAQSGVGDESGGDASDSWDISVHTKLFADYVSSLLDASLLALHRLLYILKLLGLIKAQRTTGQSSESAQTLLYSQQLLEVESRAKDQNKHLLLSLWSEIEDAIIREIRIHLLEEDVENITDHLVGHSGRPTALQQSADTEEEEDGENEEELNRGVIFRPTARHAAALFRMVVSYSAAINRMMKENGLATDGVYSSSLATAERANHERTIAVLGGRPPASLTVMESLNLKAALVAVASPAVSSENKVLGFIQSFLEEELIPVIQSSANQDMREIQLNNQHFSVTIDGHGDGVQSSLRQSHLNPQRQAVCFAAELCRRTAAPLFDFWLQLSLHRNMVSTVIENVIRGFASAARDEFENLTYGLLSQSGGRSSGMKAGVVSGTVRDPLFAVYRAQVYAGKVSFEDLVVGFVDSNSIAARSGRRVSKSAVYDNSLSDNVTNQTLLGTNSNALELHCWEAFWDVGSVRYPITKDKVAKDFQALSTVASIAYGCDWLVRRISVMCNATSRKVLSQPGPPLGASPALRRPSVKSHSNSPLAPESGGTGSAKGIVRSEVVETRNTLIGGVVGGTKELSLIAEECIAMLRGELEIVCFYFLSSLAHIKLLKSDAEPLRKISLKAGSNGNMKMNGEGSYGRSRQSFVVASGDVVHTGDEVNSEEEVIVSAFAHHLSQYVDAISATCGVSSMVGVVLSPLCSLVPRILMKCAMHIVLQNAGDVRSSNTLPTQLSTSTESLLKTRLLRIVVAIQQSTSVCIQSSVVDPETKRKLQDILTEEFERLRRYVTLLDMPLSELKAYLRSHFEEFSKEEVQVLWFKTSSKLADSTFEEIWRDLEYSSAQAAVKRNSSSGSAVSFLNRK